MRAASQGNQWVAFVASTLLCVFAGAAAGEPPPEALLLVSGETVRTGGLPEQLTLPDGFLAREALEPIFLAEPLDDEEIYLWSAATGAVTPLGEAQLASPIAHATVAVYQPTIGLVEAGIVTSAASTPLGETAIELPLGGSTVLAPLLAETGSFVVFNRFLLPESRSTPEPGTTALLASGAFLLATLGRRRACPKG